MVLSGKRGQVQKGTIQLAQALSFLHNQAKLVHLNVTPEAILINATVGATLTSRVKT